MAEPPETRQPRSILEETENRLVESPDGSRLAEVTPLTDAAKEQIKLRAAFLNGIAIATFGIGGLAPVVAALTRSDISGGTIGSLFVLSVICLVVSAVIHSHAYRHLQGLDP